jgi:prepilin peptidase CpaA
MTSPTILAVDLVVVATALTLAWAAVGDALSYRIPNLLPALVAAGFGVLAFFEPPSFLIGGLLTGLAVFAVGALLFARRLMGGGDVKLLAATSLWCGPEQLTLYAMVIGAAAVALAVLMLSPLGRLLPPPPARLAGSWGAASNEPARTTRQPMPFGVAVAAGGLWVVGHYAMMPR